MPDKQLELMLWEQYLWYPQIKKYIFSIYKLKIKHGKSSLRNGSKKAEFEF